MVTTLSDLSGAIRRSGPTSRHVEPLYGWARSDGLTSDLNKMRDVLATLPFEHGIRNWQAVFIADPRVFANVLPAKEVPLCDAAIAFGVDLDAWDRPQPAFWNRATGKERQHFMDVRLAEMRGDKNLRRDHTMCAVGMAAGFVLAKARELRYVAQVLCDFSYEGFSKEVGLPSQFQIKTVVTLKRSGVRSVS